jgi:hypothetical protein
MALCAAVGLGVGTACFRYKLASEAKAKGGVTPVLEEDYLQVWWLGRRVWWYRGYTKDLAAWLALWRWWLVGGFGVAGACLGYLGERAARWLAEGGRSRDAWLGKIRPSILAGLSGEMAKPGVGGARPRRRTSGGARREDLRLLGLTGPATLEEVQAAYHRLAKAHHPDTGGDDAAFRLLHAAYKRTVKALGFMGWRP